MWRLFERRWGLGGGGDVVSDWGGEIRCLPFCQVCGCFQVLSAGVNALVIALQIEYEHQQVVIRIIIIIKPSSLIIPFFLTNEHGCQSYKTSDSPVGMTGTKQARVTGWYSSLLTLKAVHSWMMYCYHSSVTFPTRFNVLLNEKWSDKWSLIKSLKKNHTCARFIDCSIPYLGAFVTLASSPVRAAVPFNKQNWNSSVHHAIYINKRKMSEGTYRYIVMSCYAPGSEGGVCCPSDGVFCQASGASHTPQRISTRMPLPNRICKKIIQNDCGG